MCTFFKYKVIIVIALVFSSLISYAQISPNGQNMIMCENGGNAVLNAPSGFFQYDWFKVSPSGTITSVQSGSSRTLNVASLGMGAAAYFAVVYVNATLTNPITLLPVSVNVKSDITPVLRLHSVCPGEVFILAGDNNELYKTYSWSDGTTSTTSTTPSSPAITQSGTYTVQVEDYAGCTATASIDIDLSAVIPFLEIITGGSTEVCVGSPLKLTSSIRSSAYNYKWFKDGVHLSSFPSTASEITLLPNETASYHLEISNTSGTCTATSDAVEVTPIEVTRPVISASGFPTIQCGEQITLSVPPAYSSYQWTRNGVDIPSATSETFVATQAGSYSIKVSSGLCFTTSSNFIPVTVNIPTINVAGSTDFVCGTQQTVLSVPTSHSNYTWMINGSPVQSGPSSSHTVINRGGSYQVRVIDGSCTAVSNPVHINVVNNVLKPDLSISGELLNTSTTYRMCTTGDPIAATSGYATYSWMRSGTVVSSGSSNEHTPDQSGFYRVAVLDEDGCMNTSDEIGINVKDSPPPIYLLGAEVCGGSTRISTDNFYKLYEWSNGTTGTSNVINVTTPGTYSVTVTDYSNCQFTSPSATVTSGTPDFIPAVSAVGNTTICEGKSVKLKLDNTLPSTGQFVLFWKKNNSEDVLAGFYPPVTVSGITLPTGLEFDATQGGNYSLEIVQIFSLFDPNPSGWTPDHCFGASNTIDVTVLPKPESPTVSNGTRCGDGEVTLSVSGPAEAVSYKWYYTPTILVPGETGSSITQNLIAGDQRIFLVSAVDGNGCESDLKSIIGQAYSIPQKPADQSISYCSGPVPINLLGGTSTNRYRLYDAPVGGNLLVESTSRNFVTPPLSSNTVLYAATVFNEPINCESERAAIIIKILHPPSVPSVQVCGSPAVVTLTPDAGDSGPVKYLWYDAPVGGNRVFTSDYLSPSRNVTAHSTATYYVSVAPYFEQCETARTPVTVTVHPLPTVTVASTNSPVCSGNPVHVNLELTGTPPFSITYIINGVFTTVPNINSHSYTISSFLNSSTQITIRDITDANNCTNFVWLHPSITVKQSTNVFFTGLEPEYCHDPERSVPLTPNVPGGTFSGNGVSGNIFIPTVIGSYVVTYTYVNNVSCTTSYFAPVTVHSLPVTDFSGHNSEYCLNDPASVISVTPAGGNLSGNGISFNSIDNNFYFTPSTAGTHTISCSLTDLNGCSDTEEKEIVVHDLPVVSLTGLNPSYCEEDITDELVATPASGILSGPGLTGNSFNPFDAGDGNKSVTYTFTDANGCTNSASQSTVVHPLPEVNFSGLNPSYCISSPQVFLSGNPWGGTFSGPGINGLTFNPSQAGPGIHSIIYIYTDNTTGCSNQIQKQVEVYSLPIVDFSLNAQYCQNQNITLTGSPVNGIFSGNGVSGTIFNPTWSGPFTVTYSYTDPVTNCSASISKTTTVNPIPVINYSSGGARCNEGEVQLNMNVLSNPDEVYRWFDVPGGTVLQQSAQSSFVTPYLTESRDYFVTILNTVTGCESNPATSTAVIHQLTAPNVSGPASAICPGTSFTLTASGEVGDYRWYAVPSGGSPIGWSSTLTVSEGISSSTIYYASYIDYNHPPYNCESSRTAFTVNVIQVPVPVISQTVNCGSTSLTVSGGTTESIYNWYIDASENSPVYTSNLPTFDLALPNIYLTNRFYVQIQNAGCNSSRTAVDVSFKDSPSPPSSAQGATRCGEGEVTLSSWGAWGGATYQWFTSDNGGTPIFETNKSSFIKFVSATTTFYVGTVSIDGCQSATRLPVVATVTPLNVPVVTNYSIIGPGQVTITPAGAPPGGSFRWYNASGLKLYDSPTYTNYFNQTTTLQVSSVNYTYNCESAKVPVTVTVQYEYPILSDNSEICLGESVTLSAPVGHTYQWTGGGMNITSSQPVQVSPAVTTTYTAREINSNITSQITITVMNCTTSGALHYDGADDLVEVNDEGRLNLGTGPFTMEALIRSDRLTPQGIQVILSKRNTSETDGFLFGLWSDGHLWIQMRGVPNIGYDQGPTILDGQCHHVAVTRDTLFNLKFYIDGNLTYQTVSGRDIGSLGGLRIGRNNFSGLYFDGLIGEVRIWNYERSQAQLQNEVNVRLNPQTGLLAYYVMEDGEGSQVLSDLSGNANHGRLGSVTTTDNLDPVWVNGPFSCTVQGNFKASFAETSVINNDTVNTIAFIEAFPNPFQNSTSLLIKGESVFGKVTLIITDINGVEVFRKEELELNQEVVLGSELRSGVYVVQVLTAGKAEIIKLIKTE